MEEDTKLAGKTLIQGREFIEQLATVASFIARCSPTTHVDTGEQSLAVRYIYANYTMTTCRHKTLFRTQIHDYWRVFH